jgi:hypothetical protein
LAKQLNEPGVLSLLLVTFDLTITAAQVAGSSSSTAASSIHFLNLTNDLTHLR